MVQLTTSATRSSKFWLVVLAACIGEFVVAYNTTGVMTALLAIKSDFDLNGETLHWVMNVYMLTCVVFITSSGRFADIFGKMRMFVIALAIFVLGSATIIFSGDAAMILAGRTMQGAGAAGLTSASLALIDVAAPERA